MNVVVLMGRLTREPEVRYSQTKDGDMAVAKFALAINRRGKSQEEPAADYPNCVAFGKLAEFAEKYLEKGTKITLSGHIQTGSHTNKDGNKVYTTDVIADNIEFCESIVR